MNRRIAASTIAAVAVLGLTACSGTPTASGGASDKEDTSSSAPVESGSDQSIADACAITNSKVSDASGALSQSDLAGSPDPKATVDAFTKTVEAVGSAVDSVDNAEVKAAANDVFEDFTAMRDALSKILIDQDTSAEALTAATAAVTSVQQSTTAFTTLCTS